MTHRALYANLTALVVLGITGCGSSDPQSDTPSGNTCRGVTSSLTIKDRMDQPATTFTLGEEIVGEINVTNTTGSSITLHSGSSCRPTRFQVQDSTGHVVLDNQLTLVCVMRQQPLTYLPYQTLAHTEALHLSTQGAPLPAGQYTVTALGGEFSAYSPQGDAETACQNAALRRTSSFVIQ
jgi:hypothetical protein